MKAKFNYTPAGKLVRTICIIAFFALFWLMNYTDVFTGIAVRLFSHLSPEEMLVKVQFAFFPLTLMMAVTFCLRGEITADEEGIKAVYGVWGLVFWKKNIRYADIRFADCFVRRVRRGKHGYGYQLALAVRTTDNKVQEFVGSLNVSRSFAESGSSEFDNYVAEQPLTQVCRYINERAGSPRG